MNTLLVHLQCRSCYELMIVLCIVPFCWRGGYWCGIVDVKKGFEEWWLELPCDAFTVPVASRPRTWTKFLHALNGLERKILQISLLRMCRLSNNSLTLLCILTSERWLRFEIIILLHEKNVLFELFIDTYSTLMTGSCLDFGQRQDVARSIAPSRRL